MDQISEPINSTDQKNHSYDQMRKHIVNLGSNKGDNNDPPPPQLSRLQNSLLMRIVDNIKKGLYNVEGISDTSELCTSLVN